MKKIFLTAGLVLASIVALSSLTYDEASHKSLTPRLVFAVPVKPKSTVITDDAHVYKYLKNGYQIQNAWNNHAYGENKFVVVKY
jgi:hypothetical protein